MLVTESPEFFHDLMFFANPSGSAHDIVRNGIMLDSLHFSLGVNECLPASILCLGKMNPINSSFLKLGKIPVSDQGYFQGKLAPRPINLRMLPRSSPSDPSLLVGHSHSTYGCLNLRSPLLSRTANFLGSFDIGVKLRVHRFTRCGVLRFSPPFVVPAVLDLLKCLFILIFSLLVFASTSNAC